MKKAALLIIFIFLVLGFMGCSRSSSSAGNRAADVTTIGVIFTLSGSDEFIGTEAKDGALFAFQRINSRGGVLGKRLDFIVEDDEGDPAKAIAAFNKLTTQNGAKFIIGSSSFETSNAIAQLAQQNQVLLISPLVSNVGLTKAGDYVFRVIFDNYRQGIIGADFAFDTLEARRAAILYNSDAEYNTSLADGFRTQFKELGGQVTADETYHSGDTDFSAQIARIKAANPGVIYLPNLAKDAALQAKQLRAQGISVPLLGGDGWDGVIDIATDEVLNSFWTVSFSTTTTDPRGREFLKAFNNRFIRYPTYYAALGNDAMYLLAEAMTAAGTFDVAAVRDALAKTNATHETGIIRFDSDGNPIKGGAVAEIIRQDDGSLYNSYKAIVSAR